jgi:hypothetical protein
MSVRSLLIGRIQQEGKDDVTDNERREEIDCCSKDHGWGYGD